MDAHGVSAASHTSARRYAMRKSFRYNWDLYLFLVPMVVFYAIFHYGPMYGVQIAFKDFSSMLGITGSPWAGFRHFERFFSTFLFWPLIRNTVLLSFYQLAAGFPVPILLALMLNQVRNRSFRKIVQTVTYAPHFISTVVVVGLLGILLSPRSGIVNQAIRWLGAEPIYFMARSQWFRHTYVWSGVWQSAGFSTIIYLAALTSIPPELHEAAIVDGATKLQRIRHIDIPGILPTAVILLIIASGNIMRLGFEKAFLMQSALNLDVSEIIQTYVYKIGLVGAQFSLSAAVGLFNSAINLILLVTVNRIARKLGQTSLW
jgi:putative aldouronate transport system permease protein